MTTHSNSPIDDPRLTAYALGELDDAADKAEIEALLKTSPEARALVDETRELAGMLTGELAAEPAPGLLDAQRDAIVGSGTGGGSEGDVIPVPPSAWRRNWSPLAAAALVMVAFGLWAVTSRDMPGPDGRPSEERYVAAPAAKSLQERVGDEAGRRAEAPAKLARGETDQLVADAFRSDLDDGNESVSGDLSLLDALEAVGYLGRDDNRARAELSEPTHADGKASADTPDESPFVYEVFGGEDREAGARQVAVAESEIDDVSEVMQEPVMFQPDNEPVAKSNEGASQAEVISVGFGGGAVLGGGQKKDKGEVAQVPVSGGGHGGQYKGPARSTNYGRGQAMAGQSARARTTGAGFGVPETEELKALGYIGDADDRSKRRADISRPLVPPTTPGGESYAAITDNPFKSPRDEPLSTFSIDVDTGAYANVRRFLNAGQLPPADAVRIEELINYFDYDDAPPAGGEAPFAVHVDVGPSPWAEQHRLVRIGLKGMEVVDNERPPANLVFLVDVSGSMQSQDKLPLLKTSMQMMVEALDAHDRVAIVTYAGNSRVALTSTSCNERGTILAALAGLQSGGSTNGGAGIQQAYQLAAANFIDGGVNRVVLATDGDFNVGITDGTSLEALIIDKARTGVFLSVLGFGTGNLKDSTMETLANKGNGNYAYIDSLDEGRRVLVEQIAGTLWTIAKDVKIQVEFNPARVGSYRLIGYENRILAARDFNDDTKDAGEIGAGHTVTALYEIAPPGVHPVPGIDELKYQKAAGADVETEIVEFVDSPELLTVKLRYKLPDEDVSTRLEVPLIDPGSELSDTDDDFRFAAAVAGFGMLLRDSPYKGAVDFDTVVELAGGARGDDPEGYRAEFVRLARLAADLKGRPVR